MKKLLVIIAFFLGLLAFLSFSPYFIKFDKIQDQITVKVNQALGMEVSIGEVSLHWLPYPHLFIGQVRAQNNVLSVKLPELRAIPDLKSFFYRKLLFGKIIIIDPAVEIKKIPTESSASDITMVNLDFEIEIKNGSLIFPDSYLSKSFGLRGNTISNMDIDVTIQNQRLKYDFSGDASFCGEMTGTGRIDFNNLYYRNNIFFKNFNLSQLTDTVGEKMCPVEQQNTFSIFLEGVTTDNFKLRLKGNIPAFQLDKKQSPSLSEDHVSEISIEKYDNDFFIHINDFNLHYPKMNLNGSISRRDQKETDLPIWDLDLTGQDLDLNQAREFVLALWGDNEIAQTVCDIVQGGKANSAKYIFKGPVTDFEYIQKMKIWVDVANSPIFLPDIDLRLDKATGSISILDGILTGNNLSADISSNSGTNGTLLLDLKEDATAFQLDLDLDIDVAKLKNVLENIVNEPGFLDELTHFKSIQGRAKGHLFLGDTLDQLNTTVEVEEIKAEWIYDRIPWPFSIESGSLKVLPGKTEWSSVKGNFGPHTINNISAQVTWEDQAIISVHDIEADIDGASLFTEGTFLIGEDTYTTKQFLAPVLTELEGQIHVAKGQLSGPATSPSQWQYQAEISGDNVSFLSPNLPGKILLHQASGSISTNLISIATDAQLLNDSFHLLADYQHKNLTYWQGSTQFSGTIDQQLIDWLDSKKTIPPSFQFKTPLLAKNVKLTTEGNTLNRFKLSGVIIANQKGSETATLDFDINRLKNQFQNNISFSNNNEAGKLVYNIWNSTPQKTLLTWKGDLSSNIFDSFFSKHPFTSGRVNGVFSLLSTKNGEEKPSYSGYIEAENLQWETSTGLTPFVIDTLLLSGNEDNIQISDSEISFPNGDEASLTGSIVTDTKDFDIDLALVSKKLSSKSLVDTTSFFKKRDKDETTTDDFSKERQNSSNGINGRLEFSVDDFMYLAKKQINPPQAINTNTSNTEAEISSDPNFIQDQTYPWTHVVGEAVFEDKNIQIDFSSAQLCGIEIYGQWTSEDGKTDGNYFINDTEQLKFEETLPCLGINQSIIEGDFKIETELSGNQENWKKGSLKLTSPNGIIRKMELLSKIFSVVNFTEFLTFKDLPNMKSEGLQYNDLILKSHIDQHKLIIDKAFLKGKGLNLTGQGTMDLKDLTTNFTVFVAPFKMLDSVVTSIPLVGRIVGGKKGAILTFPVKVEGPVGDPSVTPLSPTAIGKATLDFITDTLTLPFAIFTPFMEDENQDQEEAQQ